MSVCPVLTPTAHPFSFKLHFRFIVETVCDNTGLLLQVPAPFVVLAQYLPMAVLYDPATLDLSDASVADRLRKQAKTRAVKVFFFLCALRGWRDVRG